MNLIPSGREFDEYFKEHQDEGAHIKHASDFTQEVVDRFYGQGAATNWIPTGFQKTNGKFELRPGEVTVWAGINGHGKTTYLSHVMLNILQADQKVCLMSLEMKPKDSMAKMTQQASGTGQPSIPFIRSFTSWTDDKLWIYDHLGRLATSRALAVATYVRKVLKIDHMVIDSLMKCGVGEEDYDGQKNFVDNLCTIARDTGLHIHLVCHMRKGENERVAPNKFDVRGASAISDLVDNLVIVWKNLRKPEEKDGEPANTDPDVFIRIAKQRHHPWEGSFAFWFDKASQQFLEFERMRPTHIDLDLHLEAA